ncbi:hypothetical protein [Jatrophihabitans sp.]|uniref:hypothetical protein n=1 Tax=Jatrophihabitans sp. TaxID=1932789 RepID=UPI002C196CA5|nr:hypothetical protein [Jatrophihabitans sp.]
MKLGTRSRIAIAAAVLSGGALLAPAAPATAVITPCNPDNCDTLYEYYSDSTKTVLVGEWEDGPCGYVNWGQETSYVRRIVKKC